MAKKKTKKKIKKKKAKKKRSMVSLLSSTDYKVESAADTLERFSEIKSNPVLLRKAKTFLKRRQASIMKTINSI